MIRDVDVDVGGVRRGERRADGEVRSMWVLVAHTAYLYLTISERLVVDRGCLGEHHFHMLRLFTCVWLLRYVITSRE